MELLAATTSGKVAGFEKDGVAQFRGVPYAAPPVGPLRFRPPQPCDPWDGVRSCAAYGSSALQNTGGLERALGASRVPNAEACLFLNIYTPAADDGARPVLVWFHGGGFQSGTGAIPWYNGARLAAGGDVVVVTVNYRLGIFGYLHLAGVLGAGYATSANCGLLDQVASLEWVRDNIANFGGDPASVTIFGESAGGMSVGTLLGTPAAAGLFHRAIPQSGAAHNVFAAETAAAVTAVVLAELGLNTVSAEVLIDLPADRLLAAHAALTPKRLKAAGVATDTALTMPFRPVIDGAALPEAPLDAVRAGSATAVPLLAGTTKDEWNLFAMLNPAEREVDDERLHRRATARFGDRARAAEVVAAYRENRPDAGPAAISNAIQTDAVFRIPAARLVEAQCGAGGQAFMYRFDRPSTAFAGVLGACHAIEIPFVFDNLDRNGVEAMIGPVDDAARALAATMSRAWLRFARTGDPGWPAYDTIRRATMLFDTPPDVVDDPDGGERALWDGVV